PRHGGGRQRADLLPHQGGAGIGAVAAVGHPRRLRPGPRVHRRRQPHHTDRRCDSLRHRLRAGAGLCRGAHHWHSDVHVHRVDRNPRPGQSVLRWSRHQETVDLGETTMKVINYMKWRHLAAVISVLLVVASLGSLATKGMVFGLDFTGGTQIEVGFEKNAEVGKVRVRLVGAGFDTPVVVHFGSERDVLIKFQAEPDKDTEQRIVSALSAEGEHVELRRIEFVGPQVGEELRDDGGLGILVALGLVMLYVSMRFQYKFAIGAVVGLIHDVIIILGVFAWLELEFDLTVLAALLAVIGYSLNDTIIVYDRIRENFRLIRDADSIQVINESLTQVLLRTVYTSLTTLLVLFALFYFGGELIHNFALALIIGVVIGTSSSIYVAANIILWLKISREDLMQKVKVEGVDEFDGLP